MKILFGCDPNAAALKERLIALAQRRGMVLLSTAHRMFTACGLLYTHGLSGGARN